MPAVKERARVPVELHGETHEVDPMQIRAARVAELFGSQADMAAFFDVHRTQPGKWVRGTTPAGTTAALLLDVSFVWDRATEELADSAVRDWMTADNAFLDETPLHAIKRGRVADVLGAWNAYMAGSFA